MGCVPVDPGTGQDPFLDTLFPNYADLVTDTSVGACPGCGIFTQTVGTAPNRQFIIRWKANYFNSPPGPAQAEFEVVLTEGSGTLSVIYGATGDNGLTAVSGIQRDLTLFTSFSCNEATLTPGLRVNYLPRSCGSPSPTPTSTPTATAQPRRIRQHRQQLLQQRRVRPYRRGVHRRRGLGRHRRSMWPIASSIALTAPGFPRPWSSVALIVLPTAGCPG